MENVNRTGTLPGIGPFSRVGFSYHPAKVKQQPKRATLRHYPKQVQGNKCVRLVPCEIADRF